jgi:hypothetical protein
MDIGFSNAAAVRKTLWSYGIAKSPRPGVRAKEQCLGDMPWKHRATAIKPGDFQMINRDRKVNRLPVGFKARGSRH